MILLALFVVLLVAEVIYDTEKQAPAVGARQHASWVAGVEPLLARSSTVSSVIAGVEQNPSAQTLATTTSSISAIEEVLSSAQASLRTLDLPAPSATASSSMTGLLAARVAAVAAFRQMLSAAALHQLGPAIDACLELQSVVKVGDATLSDLTGELRMSKSRLFQSFRRWGSVLPRLASPGCGSLVAALSANMSLTAHFALRFAAISVVPSAVQINGVPNPTTTTTTTLPKKSSSTTTSTTTVTKSATTTTTTSTTTSTTLPAVTTTTLQIPPLTSSSVLPPTGTITVQVVVENSGNQPLNDVRVTVQLAAATTTVPLPREETSGMLSPGSARDLTFGPIALGKISGSFQLQVSATASNSVRTASIITLVRSPH